jgi:hypothetical protein
MSPRANISVTDPVSPAIDRVKQVLFHPFDLGKWFAIGFCAWLAGLGGGGGGGGGYNLGRPGRGGDLEQTLDPARDYVIRNLYWIVPLAVGLLVLGLTLWVIFTWLSSRGRFMFLHCVALDRAEVVVPWHKFGREGNSLCRFRLALGLIGIVLMLPPVVLAGALVLGMIQHGAPSLGGVLGLIGAGLMVVALGTVFAVVGKLTRDFVVPIQFLRGVGCRAGWRELLGLLSARPGHFLLYLVFQIVLSIAAAVLVLVGIFATCCIAGCILIIPYLGTVLLLPVLVFKRAYTLHYLAQYGPEFDVFAPAATPTLGRQSGPPFS